jgi:glucose-1-phosphate adenylyltransferase
MSLNNHIGIGKPWDLDRRLGGATILQPFTGKQKRGGWYTGTAHAVYKNISFIRSNKPDYVIILSGDHIYEMDYSKMVDYHQKKEAGLTIAAQPVDYDEASRFGILNYDDNMKITDFVEKPEKPTSNLASMGIYVFNTNDLLEVLEQHCTTENSDFGHHIIPPMIENSDVYAYEFNDYWRDVGTLKSFWKTNLELTDAIPSLNLYDENWKLHTRSQEKPPVKFGSSSKVEKSIVSNGSIINGHVENSVISPGVYIEKGALVKNSIIFNDTIVSSNSIINKSIIDKKVEIGRNCKIGYSQDLTPNHKKTDLLQNGLNVIAKKVTIPDNTAIKRNCRIHSYVSKENFKQNTIPSGSTISLKNNLQLIKKLKI